ncbi:MAG TPA: hypothetical protein VIH93_01710 [Thermoanaerobaculia bacterium]|jgi:hypothetical protein
MPTAFEPDPAAAGRPSVAGREVFRYARIEAPEDLPAGDERAVDVAVLDLNHGWHNLGHDSLVLSVERMARDLAPALAAAGLGVRVLSFAVRHRGMLPEPPGGRFAIYLGTGGPGHLDPARNDGVSAGSQGLREDPSWEAPAFALFDAIRADPEAALLVVCHSFGVLCRWSGAARPALRGPAEGGKRTGVLENVLSDEGRAHPWFSRFATALPQGRRLRVMENRLFDLIPPDPEGDAAGEPSPQGFVPIGYDEDEVPGRAGAGRALTMLELARDRGGVMPRIFGVNHHPEVVDRAHQLEVLEAKLARGEVDRAWYDERRETMTRMHLHEDSDRLLQLTSHYTLYGPLRFHLERQVRRRAAALGRPVDLDEDRILDG